MRRHVPTNLLHLVEEEIFSSTGVEVYDSMDPLHRLPTVEMGSMDLSQLCLSCWDDPDFSPTKARELPISAKVIKNGGVIGSIAVVPVPDGYNAEMTFTVDSQTFTVKESYLFRLGLAEVLADLRNKALHLFIQLHGKLDNLQLKS